MDNIIEILDDSSSGEDLHQRETVGTPIKKRPLPLSTSKSHQGTNAHSIEILSDGSLPSSPTRNRNNHIIEKDSLVIDESAELRVSFVEDDDNEISEVAPVVARDPPRIETFSANSKRNLKRVRSLLDDIRDEFGYSSSSDEEANIDIVFGKKSANVHRPLSGSIQTTNIKPSNLPGPSKKSGFPENTISDDVIVIDGTMSSSQAHTTGPSADVGPAMDVLKDFPMSSQKSEPDENGEIDIIPPSLDFGGVATSSQVPKAKPVEPVKYPKPAGTVKLSKQAKHAKAILLSLQKRKSNVRLLSKGDTDKMDGVDLEISMLLDDQIEDSSFNLSQNDSNDRSASQPSVSKPKVPLQTVQRSKTTDFVDNTEKQEIPAPEVEGRFVERLSRYIINGHSYTDEESEKMIQHCLKNEKAKFKLVNQIYRDNTKARECIIIDLPKSLLENFNKTEISVEELVAPATIQQSYSVELPLIRFFRHCDSIYDFKHDYYYPCEKKIIEENVVLAYYDARDFFEQYTNNKTSLYKNLRFYSKNGKQLLVVLNEVGKFKRSIQQVADRAYKAKVNEQLGETTSPSKRASKLDEVEKLRMSASKLEERLMFINREWGLQILTVNSNLEFIHSLPNIATLISKKRMDPALRFMQYAYINVKSGKDQSDVLRKVLHDVGKIPDLKAGSIVRTYPKFLDMFNDFQEGKLKSDPNGNHLMTPLMERRLFKLFTSSDPDDVLQ